MTSLSPSLPRGLIQPHRGHARRRVVNTVMLSLTGLFTLLALVPLVWIVVEVFREGGRAVNLDLFTRMPAGLGQGGGGVVPAIQGTLIVTLLASLFSVPPAILAAFYVARSPNNPLGIAVRFATDVLAGVPSIVVGLFAYALVVVPRGHYSALAASVAIAIIMLPTVTRTTEEMLKLVPASLREASLALGAPEWKTSLRVVLPAAAGGVATGIMLAVARGVGETAPLLFTALGNDRYDAIQIVRGGLQSRQPLALIVQRLIDQPVDGLTLTLWKYAQQPYPERVQQAWAVALVLMLFVLVTNVLVRLFVSRRTAARR